MKMNEEKWDKLQELTMEADMLSQVLDDALKFHENKEGITAISYLSEIVRAKFEEIDNLFWSK